MGVVSNDLIRETEGMTNYKDRHIESWRQMELGDKICCVANAIVCSMNIIEGRVLDIKCSRQRGMRMGLYCWRIIPSWRGRWGVNQAIGLVGEIPRSTTCPNNSSNS